MSFSRRGFLGTGLAGLGALRGTALAQRQRRRGPLFNVLLIVVDDLRPDLGCYGQSGVLTPNIDALAADGLTFTRAYSQQADGNASRTSLLTGLRPDTTRVADSGHFRRYLPGAMTLPQHFARYGYATSAFSKVFEKPQLDDPASWTIPSWLPDSHAWRSDAARGFSQRKWSELQAANFLSTEAFDYDPAKRGSQPAGRPGGGLASWESADAPDADLPDGKTADAVVAAFSELQDQRFFLAAGFLRPHLPFVAPSKYFALYPAGSVELTPHREPAADLPPSALHGSEELREYADIPPRGPIPDGKARELVRAYRACISYVDAQVGRVLQALEDLGLRQQTVVALCGDHGYHLGDHGLWGKRTNFELATRAPLIVSAPGQRGRGKKTAALTELVDLYPSLCEICELPRPPGLEGSSFTPLFDDPERLWKRAVFSQYPREIPGAGPGIGRTMRTDRYRYTEWGANENPYFSAELYDHMADPQETISTASRPRHVSLVNGLSGMLRDGWRSSYPPTEGPAGS